MTAGVEVAPWVVVVESDPQRRQSLVEALGPGTTAVGSIDAVSGLLLSDSSRSAASGAGVDGPPCVLVSGPSVEPAAAVPLTSSRPASVVVAVHGRGSTAELRAALSAGVGDLVGRDAPPAQLRHAVRRAGVAAQLEAELRREVPASDATPASLVGDRADHGVVSATAGTGALDGGVPVADGGLVAVLAPKGGTGGTTVAVNLALALASGVPERSGEPPAVVVVDADLQFGDVALACGAEPGRSLASLTRTSTGGPGPRPDATSVSRTLVPIPDTAVALLAAPVDPALAETLPPSLVGDVLDVLTDLAAWVVVDLPSVIDDRAMEVIDRAGSVLVVASPDPLAAKDARAAVDLLERLGLDDRWLLVSNAPAPGSERGVGALEHHLGRRVAVSIPHDPAVPSAVLRGRALLADAPSSPASRAVASLAAALRTPSPGGGGPRSPLRDVVDRLVGGAWRTRLVGR